LDVQTEYTAQFNSLKTCWINNRFSQEESENLDEILSGPNDNKVLFTKFKVDFTLGKLKCLLPKVELNDEVVNFYMELLQDRDNSLHAKYPSSRVRSYYFNSFFITKLLICDNCYTYLNVTRWTKTIDIFEMDKIFFPINLNNEHWAMAVVFMRRKRICYYDSLSWNGEKYVNGLMQWVQDEGINKKNGMRVDAAEWELSYKESNVPQQTNGYDCGVFSIICADFISDDLPLIYSQDHMDKFRKQIASAILRGSLTYSI
jgi:sentrin-specific protease 1